MGPRIDPCGTPDSTLISLEKVEFIRTLVLRLERKLFNVSIILFGNWSDISLDSRPLCQTESKAFLRSIEHATVHSPFLKFLKMLSCRYNKACSVECPFLKPNCESGIMSLSETNIAILPVKLFQIFFLHWTKGKLVLGLRDYANLCFFLKESSLRFSKYLENSCYLCNY